MSTAPTMGKLHGVEAARGVAALLVVLVHASTMMALPKYLGAMPLAGLFKFGHAGVDFFFVLSGFIIYFIHSGELGQRAALGPYWAKRFVRIYPVYWVVLIGYGLLLLVSPTREMHERIPSVILAAMTLAPHPLGPILDVAWSLSHEILFYALFSVLFFSRWLGAVMLAAWGGLVVLNVLFHWFVDPFWGQFVFKIFNAHFFFGIFVAHAVKRWPSRWPLAFLLGGALLFFGAGVRESWGTPRLPIEWPPLHLAYALGAAGALYGVVGLERAGRLQVPRLLLAMGTASYSIYLVHTIVIMVLQQAILPLRSYWLPWPTLTFIGVVIVAVAVSMWFSRLVEQPLMRRLKVKGSGSLQAARA